MSMEKSLEEVRRLLGPKIKTDEPMAHHTTFKIGGPADLFYVALTTEDLVRAVTVARQIHVPVFILGGGSNILVGDKGIRGLVIKNLAMHIGIKGVKAASRGDQGARTVFVEADSGVPINKLVRFTVDEGLAGLEMHLGLPGSVGGAIYMNSKWTKPEGYVGDMVYQVRIITPEGQDVSVPKSYFHFAYDTSTIQKTKDIVISVVFALTSGDREKLWNISNESIGYRRISQPQGILSAGCTFRNLSKAEALAHATPDLTQSAGYLIDHAGLKGLSRGDAQISPMHANFIINRGKATASDVVQLIELARDGVKKQFGVTLTEEIERVGEF